VSTGSRWSIEPDCLRRALAEWQRTNPTSVVRSRVHDRLIDLWLDPLAFGAEDRDRPGLFTARVPGTRIAIHYVLDFDEGEACVFSIAEEMPER